ncbi:Inner membrane protein yccS [Citrobacter koseri]|uniref:Inner membrane protein yccS n=1 Tax=Citrobacter koseri TaxID=545 RepID=A0A2X2V646_CITKO|nr:Inner membrane protein yccS [Citrobacter koseri]
MLGTSLYDQWYQQPILLLAGAVWYNLLTLTGHLLFPIRPLQDNLARSYEQLARYLELKSRLFDPDIEDESQAPLYDLALANGQLMATLNQTKSLSSYPLTRRPGATGEPVARCTTILSRRIFTSVQAHRIFSIRRCAIISATAT